MRGRWALIFAVFFTLYDVAFTMQYWQFESNPIVLLMGPGFFVFFKVGMLIPLVGVWVFVRRLKATEATIMADFVVWVYAIIMAVVAIFNTIQILGFRF